jgi:AcrR family transcriptional regulator
MKNDVTIPSARREREKAELRERILTAARTMFTTEGYEAVTMRKIAKSISYTATALYYHFPDKRSILMELCQQDFLTLVTYLQRIGKIADPVERLRRMGLAYVNFGIEYPQHYRLIFMTSHPEHGGCKEECPGEGDPNQDAYAFLMNAVSEAKAAGRFRREVTDVEMVVQMFWASLHGLVALHLTKGDDDWLDWRTAEKTARFQIDTLLRGLLK